MKVLNSMLSRLPPWLAVLLGRLLSLCLGALTAVILHYVLFRIDIPGKPFIYVAF
jgi:hypothetical protein